MLAIFKGQLLKNQKTLADSWFGKPDVVQVLSDDMYFKEWICITDVEILQIYYNKVTRNVSIKSISKHSGTMVNDVVTWNMEFSERQALDYLVQNNPRNYLSFHPNIDNLYFTNMELK
jgi:hypothetical protein